MTCEQHEEIAVKARERGEATTAELSAMAEHTKACGACFGKVMASLNRFLSTATPEHQQMMLERCQQRFRDARADPEGYETEPEIPTKGVSRV